MIETLKIYPVLKNICKSVKDNSLTIVSTPTGSGKTLAVPFSLGITLNKRVFVTMPRVLLAKQAAYGVIKLITGEKMSHKIGVMTGKHNQNTNAPLMFCTERSFLNRVNLELDDILIVDEVHEQGINTEEVLYFAKQHVLKGGKVVLMSATMDCSRFVEYFGTGSIIELPESERQFETIIEDCPDNYLDRVVGLGGITLIGVAGKKDIEDITKSLKTKGYKHPILPLHGEIEEDDENLILRVTKEGKDCTIIGTSIAMSGITFENLDTVIPPIEGNRIEEGKLVSYILSKAEVKQWEGRVGRMKKGRILRIDKNITRPLNPTPEILRIDTTDVLLSFASKGLNLKNIELMNKPTLEKLETSSSILEKSGILKEDGTCTEKGLFINNFGEGITTGNLYYEGKRLGIENFALKVATIISVGTPFRKSNYIQCKKFDNSSDNTIAKLSEHYAIIRAIETDNMLDSQFNLNIKDFCIENLIFLKGLKLIKREFDKIDRNYIDKIEVTYPLLVELFKNQTTTNLFRRYSNGYDNVITNKSGSLLYCNLTPVQLRRGRLAEFVTILEQN